MHTDKNKYIYQIGFNDPQQTHGRLLFFQGEKSSPLKLARIGKSINVLY